jgi:uncharacterized protein (DUF1501 family)
MRHFNSTRRGFLRHCAAGTTLAFLPALRSLLAAESLRGPARSCILIFLEGGPSHIDTFDPKPGAPTSGPFEAIDTSLAGVKFSQHVPRLAQAAGKLAVIRSLHSREGDHDRATVLLHTGYIPNPALKYPSLGATVARECSNDADSAPAYVSISGEQGPGFLGPEFGPFRVDNLEQPSADVGTPEGMAEARLARRLAALERFNASFAASVGSHRPLDFTRLSQRADRFRRSPALQPHDVEQEPEALREAYGLNLDDSTLARSCLLARRANEHGVRFVEIHFGGWDTHADNFNQVQLLASRLDAALSALITDLSERGLLESTLVACFGEFGRTPQINGDNGRDHWPDAFSALLAGGGVRGGQVIGASDDEGAQVKDRAVEVADLHASIFHAFGLDPAKPHQTPDGRLVKLTDGGNFIRELFTG